MSKNYLTEAKKFDRKYDLDFSHTLSPSKLRLTHASLGLSGEVGEVTDIVKKHVMYNKPLDKALIQEECGDVLWYMAIMLDELGLSFEQVMQHNIDKLSKRYPEGFSEKAAVDRNDKK